MCHLSAHSWLYLTTHESSLAKDQAEINKIIAEVSKGSKFYEVWDLELAISSTYLYIVLFRMKNEKMQNSRYVLPSCSRFETN